MVFVLRYVVELSISRDRRQRVFQVFARHCYTENLSPSFFFKLTFESSATPKPWSKIFLGENKIFGFTLLFWAHYFCCCCYFCYPTLFLLHLIGLRWCLFYKFKEEILSHIWYKLFLIQLFYDGGPYHKETSPLICKANQWTGFSLIGSSIMKELILTH